MESFEFGRLLRELRKRDNMTQQALGERLGLTKTAISKYENGTASPSLEMLRSLSVIFHVSTDYLCGIEHHGTVSVNYLTDEQVELIRKMIEAIRRKSKIAQRNVVEENYDLIGKLIAELVK